jgi:TRAP-type mannitol/chloroaromatic compound transport system permease small subunit
MIAASIIAVTAYIIRAVLDVTSIATLALSIVLFTSIYAAAVYTFCLNKEQRIQIHSMLGKLRT